VSSAWRDDREGVVFLSFWAVGMFFSCALYNFTIMACCLLEFRSSLDRASKLLRMIEECDKRSYSKYHESCTLIWKNRAVVACGCQ
jgi:hypothetical protein